MSKIWIIIILAIALRIFLSLATYHPDIAALANGGQFIASGHILNLYDFSSDTLVLNYPPLIYWYFGFFDLFFNGIFGLLKLPYLIFDLLLGFLLYKMVEPKKALLAFTVWMFNPISLYATYMMGQFDIIPTFFSVLSIYLAIKNKLALAALALGGGIAFKLYPVFLIIPLILLSKRWWMRAKIIILTILPYLVSVLPYLSSVNFRTNALFANQSSKSLYASIPVSGGESILLFPTMLIVFYLLIWNEATNKMNLWKVYLIPLLVFFILTHFHPQWLIWVFPYLILELINNDFKNWIAQFLLLISWIISLFFFDPSLTIGLFAPLFPFLNNLPSIWIMMGISMDYNFSRAILQTVFAASALLLIVRNFPKNAFQK
ncbi:MAG: hypothetical protein Q8P92_01775 [Candidatus Daviesbacteria bacterium]|nr:hypothetical protein [Candidatus Daviesbacteria bacterium]